MKKLRVILVDDETLICRLIRMKVNWDALDMEVIEEFSSSKKALAAVPSLQPDIIITDICMPGMDGLEFSEECISLIPTVKVIILTGYDEFNYAMRSIHVGVADYILKPVNADKLHDSLEQIKERIMKERNNAEKYKELSAQIEENLPVFCENFLNQVILESVASETFRNKMEYFHKQLHPENEDVQAAVVEIKRAIIDNQECGSENDEIILYMKARNYIEQFFEKDKYMFFLRDGIGRIVILSNNHDVHFMDCMELLKKMLITNLKCFITIGIGTQKYSYEKIEETYKEAVEALQYKVVEGDNCLIFYEELNKDNHSISTEEHRIWEEAKIYVNTGMGEKADECIKKIWKQYTGEVRGAEYRARNMFAEIVTWCLQEAVLNDLSNQQEYKNKMKETGEITGSVLTYKKMASECVLSLAGEMSQRKEKKNSSMIHDIIRYMNENLSDPDLSMNKVAENSFISTGHLGRMMKKYTGKTYGEYLSDLRFCKAKELLSDMDIRGYEIGERIGIVDSHYLSIWFKKMSGCSLSEYRKKI